MLKKLTIKNFILIKDINVDFDKNLNVITGETGAGKSLILKALNIIIGKRISGQLIRRNCPQASLIGVFSCSNDLILPEELDIEIDDEIIIRKIIKSNGTSKTYLNDIPVTTNLIQKITNQLLEVHGQSEQKHLTSSDKQLDYLDSFLDEPDLFIDVKDKHNECKAITDELHQINETKTKSGYEYNYLVQIKDDLETLSPLASEYEKIDEKYTLLKEKEKNNKKITENLNLFNSDAGINDLISKAKHNISALPEEICKNLNLNERFRDLTEQAETLATEFHHIKKDLNDNKDDFCQISERLSEYKRLSRKFQRQPEALHELYTEITTKINYLKNLDTKESTLKEDFKAKQNHFLKQAQLLSSKRSVKIATLSQEIEKHLHDLNMPSAKFIIKKEELPDNSYNSKGIDKISFLIAANLGQEAKEISKAASGGELSRIMLALKISQKTSKNTATLIFDEIDTGIGGNTADKLGHKLHELGKNTQVILVTHQALIANKAQTHFLLKKTENMSETLTTLENLDQVQKDEEIERMLFGISNNKDIK